jgi:fructose-bisphosphate aldolase class I
MSGHANSAANARPRFEAIRDGTMAHNAEMLAKIRNGKGFIAALDQSGGSTPGALKAYGYNGDEWSSDEEMFDLVHQMRVRIITSPPFNGDRILGAILFEKTMDGEAGGKPVPECLWHRGVVPFLKVDKGLADERDGVRLMKDNPTLDALLERAVAKGVFGTKMRSVINSADQAGIVEVVRQQFAVAEQILGHGLVPIIEPEVSIKSPDRADSDLILLGHLTNALDALPEDRQVMLKLSIPAQPGLFEPLIRHPRVLRVVALSGGFSRDEACRELAKNEGMVASFSRALLEGLRHDMSDEEFNRTLDESIAAIYEASTEKVAA